MIEVVISYFALISAFFGAFAWLIRSIYKATRYLERIQISIDDLSESSKELAQEDRHICERLTDIERFLGKTTEFTPRNYG